MTTLVFTYQRSAFFCFSSLFLVYFLTSSADKLMVNISLFNLKLTNLVGLFCLLIFVLWTKRFQVDRQYLKIFLLIFPCILISSLMSLNKTSTLVFVIFFAFNYLIYFLFPCNLMSYLGSEWTYKVYVRGCVWVGIYALAQVLFSAVGVTLPGVGQWIGKIARGAAFSYEPSYYALYLTPFVMFENARYLMGSLKRVGLWTLVGYNFLFLLSTSTGCFFSYIAFMGIFCFFNGNVWRNILRFSSLLMGLFGFFLLVFDRAFLMMFKFFYQGLKHSSFAERWDGLVRDFEIFTEAPWIGVGLGGVSSYAVVREFGEGDILDKGLLNNYVSTNVTAEVFASVGLLGVAAFAVLLYQVFCDFRYALKMKEVNEEDRIQLKAFAISLLVMFFALQFSQSIMRAYVWIHVAIAVAFAREIMRKYEPIRNVPAY